MSEREDVEAGELIVEALSWAETSHGGRVGVVEARALLAAHDELVRADERVRLAGEVEALHHARGTTPESCDHCGHRWPCPTIRALVPVPGVRLTEEE